MGLSGLLAAIAGDYTQRYLDRINKHTSLNNQTKPANTPAETAASLDLSEPTDCYEPSVIKPVDNSAAAEQTDIPADNPDISTEAADAPTAPAQPEESYYYKRSANLDYKIDLRFNLGTLTRTVQYLANGETDAVEMFAAAGFGLSADFNLQGSQTIETNMAEYTDNQNAHVQEQTSAKSRQIGKFKAQSENFKLHSFMRQAADINRSLDVKVRDNHYKAVNKIAYRYSVDNRFSFSFAERFNIQTEKLVDKTTEVQNGYFDAAGSLADSGTTEMMTTFFDAVESYLAETEEAFTADVDSFFRSAAAELGFNSDLVDLSSEQLTATIESFFDRVSSTVAQLEARYVPAEASTPITGVPDISLYDPETYAEPVQLAEV
ncbi:MAG: hypothetical protein ACOYVF_08335 [Candidatus Zixiibacteriota bacterium]